jgi:hypothetical protein
MRCLIFFDGNPNLISTAIRVCSRTCGKAFAQPTWTRKEVNNFDAAIHETTLRLLSFQVIAKSASQLWTL